MKSSLKSIIMNKLAIFLLLLVSLFFAERTYSSHLYGGEIRWECSANGKYIFYVEYYIDCSGIPFDSTNHRLSISGNPLPKDANNNILTGFFLNPYNTSWSENRNGDLSPECNPRDVRGPLSCGNEDSGATKVYLYKSEPITLKGVPPISGWVFKTSKNQCCRPKFENLRSSRVIFRATMFPSLEDSTKIELNANPCIDSSPQFKSLPVNNICREIKFSYNPTGIDIDLDSLVFSWGRSYSHEQDTTAIFYEQGFDYNNPTPDTTFSKDNVPSTLDKLTGLVKMRILSGSGVEKFLVIIKVDSYRNGKKNATIYRELPITVFDCPRLLNGKVNTPPIVKINGKLIENEVFEVIAGDTVIIPIIVSDLDKTGIPPFFDQLIRLTPNGLMLTKDRTSRTPCDNSDGFGGSLVEPCAYFEHLGPRVNTRLFPPTPSIGAFRSLVTRFVWQTDCSHIGTKTGAAGTNTGIYRFVMRVTDDHCPIPGINYPTLTIKVRDPYPLRAPIMKGIDVGLDGSLKYQWVPPIDSNDIFEGYLVESSTTLTNAPPIWKDTLNQNVEKYKQSKIENLTLIYDTSDPPNISSDYKGKDFHVRMSTKFSSCNRAGISSSSEPVRVIQLNVRIKKDSSDQQEIKLNWNSPKPQNSSPSPYLDYESNTKYYVWRNDSKNVRTLKNWRLVGETTKTTLSLLNDEVCVKFGAFRVEARDTVVTWKHQDSTSSNFRVIDTLTFSTFSLIDTVLLKPDKTPPNQFTIDLLSYDYIKGDLIIKWDDPNPGGIDSLTFITDIINTSSAPLQYRTIGKEKWDIVNKQFKIASNQVDASTKPVFIGAIAIDACGNGIEPSINNIHNTIDVQVNWEACDSSMYIRWNKYTNFGGSNLEYLLYLDSNGSGNFKKVDAAIKIEPTSYQHKIYEGGKVYRYLIKAKGINLNGQVVISNSNIDSAYASFEAEPKFGYISNVTVINSEYIQLNYLLDKQTAVKNYTIYRGLDSSNMNPIELISGNSIISNEFLYEDNQVQVNNHSYYYQVVANNFCDLRFHDSNLGTSLLLSVESGQESLKNVLKWNSYLKWDNKVSHYNIYRGIDKLPSNSVYKRIEKIDEIQHVFVDDIAEHADVIGEYCYQIEAIEEGSNNQSQPVVSRSNLVCLIIKPLFYIPNAFAPNGINKEFLPKGQFINHKFFEMNIFDRFGNELFRSRDINKGWDGRFAGNLVQIGTYVYVIRFSDAEGNEYQRKGTVTVVR